MKKSMIAITLVAAILLCLCVPAFAIDARADMVSPNLSFSGANANCSCTITAIGKSINATLQLWQGNNLIATWPLSGTSYAGNGGSVPATRGLTYTLKIVGVIGGEIINTSDVNGTCP